MTKQAVELETVLSAFKGLNGVDYSIRVGAEAENAAVIELKDGDHSVMGLVGDPAKITKIKFGNGISDVWLAGPTAWGQVKVSAKDGNHHVLIREVGSGKHEVKLGDGNSVVMLGTQADDLQSKFTGGKGDFSIQAGALDTVQLGDGSHIIYTGLVNKIEVGSGDSQISFASGHLAKDQLVTAGIGNLVVTGEALTLGATTTVTLGDGIGPEAGSDIHLTGAYAAANIAAGRGNHEVFVARADSVSVLLDIKEHKDAPPLEETDGQTVIIGHVSNAATVQLGRGNHLVALGTMQDDDQSTVTAGDGDSRIKMDGGKSITLGMGDHVLDLGEVLQVSLGGGSSVVSFRTGLAGKTSYVSAGDGSHTILGTSTGVHASADIKVGIGDSAIQLIGGHVFNDTKIKGDDGNHTVFVEHADGISIDLKDGNQTVQITDVESGDQGPDGKDGVAKVKLGNGDHRIELGTKADDLKTTVEAGHGDTQLRLHGGDKVQLGDGHHIVDVGDVREVKLGDGNTVLRMNDGDKLHLGAGDHRIHAGEVKEIVTASGSQRLLFEAGKANPDAVVTTAGTDADVIVGLATSATASVKIASDQGDDTISLVGSAWKKAEIDGGAGYDVLYVEEQAFRSGAVKTKNIEEIVFLANGISLDDALSALGLNDGSATFPLPGAGFPTASLTIDPIVAATVDVADVAPPELQLFELVPTPDPDGQGYAVELVFDDAPRMNLGNGSREDRLMESPSIFFLRVDSMN